MLNTRTLNSFVLNNSLVVNERTTITDPTLVGPLPSVVNLGSQFSLNSTTSPPVSKVWHQQVALQSGSPSSSSSSSSSSSGIPSGCIVLDLTNLPDPVLGSVDASDLSLMSIHVTGLPGNQGPITMCPGITHGYFGWGLGIIVGPGDVHALLFNETPAVGMTNRYLILTGCSGDSVLVCFGFG